VVDDPPEQASLHRCIDVVVFALATLGRVLLLLNHPGQIRQGVILFWGRTLGPSRKNRFRPDGVCGNFLNLILFLALIVGKRIVKTGFFAFAPNRIRTGIGAEAFAGRRLGGVVRSCQKHWEIEKIREI